MGLLIFDVQLRMPQTINILFLAAEAEPFVKVGGLGDVAGTLPRALRALHAEVTGDIKLDVRLVLPLHSVIRQDALRPMGIYSIPRGDSEVQVEAFEGVLDGMPVYFIDGQPIRARDRKSTRLNSSHSQISYAVFCLKKKNKRK